MSTKDDTPAAPAEAPRKPAASRAKPPRRAASGDIAPKASPAATRAGASWPW